jgi:hypothetical protein
MCSSALVQFYCLSCELEYAPARVAFCYVGLPVSRNVSARVINSDAIAIYHAVVGLLVGRQSTRKGCTGIHLSSQNDYGG